MSVKDMGFKSIGSVHYYPLIRVRIKAVKNIMIFVCPPKAKRSESNA